jgi:hypothetical protein
MASQISRKSLILNKNSVRYGGSGRFLPAAYRQLQVVEKLRPTCQREATCADCGEIYPTKRMATGYC